MVQRKRVVIDPVAKGKIDPAVIKEAVKEVTEKYRLALRKERLALFLTCLIEEKNREAKNDVAFISMTRTNITRFSKKLCTPKKDVAQVLKEGMMVYVETIITEALRRPKKSGK